LAEGGGLAQTDFRPEAVRRLQADRLQTEAVGLPAAAADDGKPYRARMGEFLTRVWWRRRLFAAAGRTTTGRSDQWRPKTVHAPGDLHGDGQLKGEGFGFVVRRDGVHGFALAWSCRFPGIDRH
jgi:hypothetical protein